jgi:hypothetical protein
MRRVNKGWCVVNANGYPVLNTVRRLRAEAIDACVEVMTSDEWGPETWEDLRRQFGVSAARCIVEVDL